MSSAEYEVIEFVPGEYIYIKDVGVNCRSVTNDAENVVEKLFKENSMSSMTRIFYKDSAGQIDELLHAYRKFIGFKAGHEGVAL